MNDYGFGNFIYELRTEKGMSQSELGKLLGVSNKAVSKWETGAAVPRPEKLTKLAEILGVTVAELLCAKRAEKENGDGEVSFAIDLLVREYRRAKTGLTVGVILFLLSPPLMLLVLGIAWATGDVYSQYDQWAVILLVLCFLLHFAGGAGVIVFFLLAGKRKRMMYASFPHRKEEIAARSHTLPPAKKTGKLAIVVLCGFLLMLLAVEIVLCVFGVLDKDLVGIVTLCGAAAAAVGNTVFVRLWARRVTRHIRAGSFERAIREGKFLLEAWLPGWWSVIADAMRLDIAASYFALGDDGNFLAYLGEIATAGGKIAAGYWRCLQALAQGGRSAFLAEYETGFLPIVRKSDKRMQKIAESYGERLRLFAALAADGSKEEVRKTLLPLVENPRARKLIEAL